MQLLDEVDAVIAEEAGREEGGLLPEQQGKKATPPTNVELIHLHQQPSSAN